MKTRYVNRLDLKKENVISLINKHPEFKGIEYGEVINNIYKILESHEDDEENTGLCVIDYIIYVALLRLKDEVKK